MRRARRSRPACWRTRDVPTGDLIPLGRLRAELSKATAPGKFVVTVALKGTEFANDWEIWVYPPKAVVNAPADVVVSRAWDDATKAALAAGKPVVLFPQTFNAKKALPGRFLPVFWSPIWFPTQRPNTMGILCDPKHPALAAFPTDFYSNWQWYELLEKSRTLILDDTPATFRPIVSVIDNFARNHKLGNVIEARVGSGRLLACTIDLPRLVDHPAARQLMKSLYDYAGSQAFQPTQTLETSYLDTLLVPTAADLMARLGAKVVHTDSQQDGFAASNILDGDPDTMWHTTFGDSPAPFPHEVVVEFPKPVNLAGVVCLPRQDNNPNGWIKEYRIEVSADGKTWEEVAHGRFDRNDAEKTVKFARPATARALRFVALSGFDKQPFASLAELSVIEAGK